MCFNVTPFSSGMEIGARTGSALKWRPSIPEGTVPLVSLLEEFHPLHGFSL